MKLKESELEVLRVLYELDRPSTTRDIFDVIVKERAINQTTVNTVVSGMVKKGALEVVEERRPSTYVPKKSVRQIYDAHLKQAAARLFGKQKGLVMKLLFGKQKPADIEEAKKLLEEMD